jgi:hypothetical protein
MDPKSELKALESRLLSVIECRDAGARVALEKVNLRLDQHREKIKGVFERLREVEKMVTELEEKFLDLDSRKLDRLDDREIKSREETAVIFDQFLHDQEQLIKHVSECNDSDGLVARLDLVVTRLAEVERIVRTQIR